MSECEKKAEEIRQLLESNTGDQLAAKVNRKSGSNVSATTITRAGNNKDISRNTLCLIHYVLTH